MLLHTKLNELAKLHALLTHASARDYPSLIRALHACAPTRLTNH